MNIQAWVAAATVVFAGAASASVDVGTLGASPKTFQGDFAGVTALPGEPFFQTVTFSLAQAGGVVGTLGQEFGQIALSKATLDANSVMTIAAAGSTAPTFNAAVTPVKTATGYSFSFDAVPAGNYVLGLSGSYVTGVTGFKGSLAAVPEPSTLALSALGMLALGAAVRRRRG
jgi:hypothetical protein